MCRITCTTGTSGGCPGETELLYLRAAEKVALAMDPLAFGVSGKNAPGLRT